MTVSPNNVYTLTKHGIPLKPSTTGSKEGIDSGTDAGCGVALDFWNKTMQAMSGVFRYLSLSVQFGHLNLTEGLTCGSPPAEPSSYSLFSESPRFCFSRIVQSPSPAILYLVLFSLRVLRGEPGIPRGWTRYKITHCLSPIRLVQREVVRCYQSMKPFDAGNFGRQTHH